VSNLEGNIECYEAANGFNIKIHGIDAKLPIGAAKVTGTVLIPNAPKTLDISTTIDLTNIPKEYVVDLISELKDGELLGAKNMGKDELTLINGKLGVAVFMDLVPFALQKTKITNANVSMSQRDSIQLGVQNLNLNLDGLNFARKPGTKKITGVENAKGELHIDAVNIANTTNIPIDIGLAAKNNKFNISFSTLRDTVMVDQGALSFDLSKSPFELGLNYNLENIDIAEVIRDYDSEELMQGNINAAVAIKGVGKDLEELVKSLEGNVNISGDSIQLHGIDLDNILKKYKRSQKFNLADVSAFLMAGPLGAAVTKGAAFTSLIAADFKPEHTTFVSKAVANWKIDQGILATEDVAFSTRTNRIAFEGSLDFANDSIPGFTIYVVDKKGCSLMEQNMSGKFDAIQMGKLKIAKTLLGSVINLVNSVVGAKCEVVYDGTIAHPEVSKK
jgi:AsmA protein